MKVTVIYFSPSGTTKKTLEYIVSGMGDVNVEYIDMSKPENREKKHIFSKDDIVIYGTITAALLFTLNKQIFSTFEGNGALFVGIAMYGNGYYGVTLKQLQRRARQQGFRVIGLGAVVGQHSEDGTIATGRPDEKDQEALRQFGSGLMSKIRNEDYTLRHQPQTGWSKSLLYNIIVFVRQFQMNSDYSLPVSFKTKEIDSTKCIECKTCEKNCPVQAIDVTNKHFDLQKCVCCYRCINKCPKKAIRSTSKSMNSVVADFGKRVGRGHRQEPTLLL